MKLSRRAAGFLLAVAGWNVVIWSTFVRNLAMDHGRPRAFYVAHTVLIVVDLAIAAGLAAIGWRAWSAAGDGMPAHDVADLGRTPAEAAPVEADSLEADSLEADSLEAAAVVRPPEPRAAQDDTSVRR